MAFANPLYEAQLETESLKFLQAIENDNNTYSTKHLAQKLINQIFNQNDSIFQLKSTGNYGIALNSIVSNGLCQNNEEKAVVALVGYWAITNHLQNNDDILLRVNRAVLLYSNKHIFSQIYKQSVQTKYNPYTIDYSVALSSADNTLSQLYLYDLFLVKDKSSFAADLYRRLVSSIADSSFKSKEYYDSIHDDLKKIIRTSFS